MWVKYACLYWELLIIAVLQQQCLEPLFVNKGQTQLKLVQWNALKDAAQQSLRKRCQISRILNHTADSGLLKGGKLRAACALGTHKAYEARNIVVHQAASRMTVISELDRSTQLRYQQQRSETQLGSSQLDIPASLLH